MGCRQETAPKYRIGFSQCTGNDDWRRNMLTEMKRELFYHPEMQLLYKDAESDSRRQVQQIKELMVQQIDILVVSPNEAAPLAPVIAATYGKGIPVIILDRKAATDSFTAYIGGDNYNIGKLAAEYIAGQLGGKGRIVEVTGLRGSSPTVERHQGFHDALVHYPRLQLIATLEGSWVADKTLAAAAAAASGAPNSAATPAPVAATPAPVAGNPASVALPDFTKIVSHNGPAVVNIRVVGTTKVSQRQMPQFDEDDPFFEFFRRFQPQ